MIINSQTIPMLTQVFNAAFLRGFKGFGVEQDWTRVAQQETSTSRENVYPYLGHFPKMREWLGDRQYKNLQQYNYRLENRLFESTVDVRRIDIEDDQYGVYTDAFQQAGASVKTWPNDLVFGGGISPSTGTSGAIYSFAAAINGSTQLCYDGQPFFNNSHPMAGGTATNYDSSSGSTNNSAGNLWMLIDASKAMKPFIFQMRQQPEIVARMNLQDPVVFEQDLFRWGIRARGTAGYGFWQVAYGSVNDLTISNFRSYRSTMETYVSDEGYRLGTTPTLLVCGPSLRSAAKDLLNRLLIPDPTDSHAAATSNAEANAVELLVTPHLI